MTHVLDIKNLEVVRGPDSCSWRVQLPRLTMNRGDVLAITGRSGCGKSTLLEAIGLLLLPARVERFLMADRQRQEVDVVSCFEARAVDVLADMRARSIGFVLQSGGLLPYLTVGQNISLPRRMLGMSEHSQIVDEVVSRLGLTALLQKRPAQLSIGERQRVAFARAIAHTPNLLLADEPTAALDPVQARGLFELMFEFVQRFEITAIVVSHDWPLVRAFGIRSLSGVGTVTDGGSPGTVFA